MLSFASVLLKYSVTGNRDDADLFEQLTLLDDIRHSFLTYTLSLIYVFQCIHILCLLMLYNSDLGEQQASQDCRWPMCFMRTNLSEGALADSPVQLKVK